MDQQAFLAGFPYMPGPGKLLMGDLQFHVTGAVTGNTTIQSFFNPVADGWADNNFVFSLNADFGKAWFVPEPATGILVSWGFLGLIAAARLRRRG